METKLQTIQVFFIYLSLGASLRAEIPISLKNEIPYLSGNKLVKAVRTDQCTVDSSRGLYARVCVEVDLKKTLVPQFLLNDDIQRVEYEDEGLHFICFECGE